MTLYMEYQKYRRDGMEEGLREGLREGRREGLLEGRRRMLEMARSLLALNVPVEVIEKSSGMTREEILALQDVSVEQH